MISSSFRLAVKKQSTTQTPTADFNIAANMVAEHGLLQSLKDEWTAAREAFKAASFTMSTGDTLEIQTAFKSVDKMFEIQEKFLSNVDNRFKGMSTDLEKQFTEVNKQFGEVNRAVVSGISKVASGTPLNKEFKADVGNYKAVQSLKIFDNDRDKFVEWNDKLLNAIS